MIGRQLGTLSSQPPNWTATEASQDRWFNGFLDSFFENAAIPVRAIERVI
jgi:hypothetical protein